MNMERTRLFLTKASHYWLMLGALLSLSLFIFTYPPITFGLWPQSELVFIGLLAICLSMGCALAILMWSQPQRLINIFYHPLVLCVLAISIVSILFSFTNEFPRRSWFGAPELGEGALWYVALAVLTMSLLLLKNRPIFRKVISVYALVSALFVTLLSLKGDNIGLWRPYFFTDYLAFYGLFLFPILVYSLELKKMKWLLLAYGLASIPIIFSGNHSAEPLVLLLPIVMAVTYYLRNAKSIKWLCVAAVVIAPIAIVLLVYAMGYFFPPGSKLAMITHSIWSRYQLIQTAFQSFQHDSIMPILFGHGWGAFTDIAATYIPVQETKLYMLTSSGTDKAYWDSLSRADFHSHAQVIEAFVSIGMIGTVFILLLPVSVVMSAPKQKLPIALSIALGFVAVSAMWFQFAITLPFMALGFVSIVKMVPKSHALINGLKHHQAGAALAGLGLLFCISFLSFGTVESYLLAKHSNKFATPEKSKIAANMQCGDELGDMAYGGQRLAIVNHEVNYFLIHNQEEKYPEDWYDRLDWLRCAVDRYLANGAGARFKIIDLLGRAEWANAKRKEKELPQVQKLLNEWEEHLDNFLAKSPSRSDLAAPYVVWRLSENQEEIAYAFAKKLYLRNTEDPVALWFIGLYELKAQDKARFGLEKMRAALERGIQNIIPIEKSLINEIQEAKV